MPQGEKQIFEKFHLEIINREKCVQSRRGRQTLQCIDAGEVSANNGQNQRIMAKISDIPTKLGVNNGKIV
jgi:hypothetical protein